MVKNKPANFQVQRPTKLRAWLLRHGLGAFEPLTTVVLDEMVMQPGLPALESILVSPLALETPTTDFALSSPETEALWDTDTNLLAEGFETDNCFQPLGRVRVDGTIYLKDTPSPQLELATPSPPIEGVARPKIIAPSQRRATPQAPHSLNLFELLLPILLPPEGVAPEGLVLPSPLYEFQNGGVAFLGERESALLGDDMGLGKTVQAIVALRLLVRTGRIRGALIICPKAIVSQWRKHLDNWAPELPCYVVDGVRERRRVFWETLAGKSGMSCHTLLATYETVRQDQELLSAKPFDLVILDEVQRIKNRGIETTRAVRSLNAKRRWGLSGTPLENRIEDLHSIFSFLKPGLLKDADSDASIVRKKIEPYFLRRRREDVLPNLPPIDIQDQLLELTPAQRAAYERAEQEGVIKLRTGTDITVQHVLALITRLKQICNFDPATGESAKAEFVLEHLDEIYEAGDKALLFSQYVETLKILHEKMERYQPLLYTGGLGDRQRKEVLKSFKEDQTKQLLMISLKAGGLGLDLQVANFVFLYDLWWNPAVEDQAIGRVWRIGQEKAVFVRRLLSENTIEEGIVKILKRKEDLIYEVIEGLADVDLKQSLTEEELFGLFGLKPPRVVAEEEARSGWQQVDAAGFERMIAEL